ncbi:hypothetical protein ES708_16739 [subsurface metagenome]
MNLERVSSQKAVILICLSILYLLEYLDEPDYTVLVNRCIID